MATNLIPIPASVPAALQVLDRLQGDVEAAETYTKLLAAERSARAIKEFWGHVVSVKTRAELVIIVAQVRCGQEEAKIANPPHRPAGSRRTAPGYSTPEERGHSSTRVAHRLKQLADLGKDKVLAIAAELHARGKDATQTAVLKTANAEITKERRNTSRRAVPLADGMDLRIGDCRSVLTDIADNSIPLILTDPPYGDQAEPLYAWLAQWAAHKLIPGGSLICYTGQSRLDRDIRILGDKLRYWWLLVMPHHQSQRLPGKFVIANFKPVLWYVKEFRRGRSLLPDMLHSIARDKDRHAWGQGDGGVSSVVEHLSDPGETIVDPFAGTATWGRIAAGMGRRWIGADIEKGGSERVA